MDSDSPSTDNLINENSCDKLTNSRNSQENNTIVNIPKVTKEAHDEHDSQENNTVLNTEVTKEGDVECDSQENSTIVNTPELVKEGNEINSTAKVVDEDAVLGEDESAKEFDGNIDEDELLKDTDGDEFRVPTEQNESDELEHSTTEQVNCNISQDTNNCSNQALTDSSSNEVEKDIATGIHQSDNIGNIKESTSFNTNKSEVETTSSALSSNCSQEKELSTFNNNDKENDESIPNSDNTSKNYNNDEESENESSRKEKEEKTYTNDDSCSGTKFLHIDQDNSRPDDSFEVMETGGEDPFAQTSDIAMETSELSEKDNEIEKSDFSGAAKGSESMDINEISSDSMNNLVEQNEIQNEKAKESDKTNFSDAIQCSESMDVDDISADSATNVSRQNETESEKTEKIVASSSTESKNNEKINQVEDKLNENNEVSIVSDEGARNNNESAERNISQSIETNKELTEINNIETINIDQTSRKETNATETVEFNKLSWTDTTVSATTITSSKSKGRPAGRQKTKSKKELSDESSDSDFEIEVTSSNPRPKRSAAKKAESQIKVLSVAERSVDQEDADAGSSDSKGNEVQPVMEIEEDLDPDVHSCYTCKRVGPCAINILTYGKTNYFCDDACFAIHRSQHGGGKPIEVPEIIPPASEQIQDSSTSMADTHVERSDFVRKCGQCSSVVPAADEKTLSWETMDFCSEECLGKYQQELGSFCANCKGNVQPASLGKYCVRFGYEVKQFCCSSCLEEFKKGLKVCSFCQKDISSGAEGFLAPVGDKGTFKDFCTQACMEKYEQMSSNVPPPPQIQECDVCKNVKLVEVEVFFDNKINKLCSDICFTAYKFANQLTVDKCDMCNKYFDKGAAGEKFNIFYDEVPHNFCCKTCMNVYILAKRKIVPCNWCKVKKYNFDMIKKIQTPGPPLMMCSLNCLTLYQVSVNAVSSRRIKCDMCLSIAQAQYHLTMSDATIRNFCTYPCVMNFQQQYSKSPITLPSGEVPPVPTGGPVPVISSVTSLANGPSSGPNLAATSTPTSKGSGSGKLGLVTRLIDPPICKNKITQTRPIMNTKSVSCRPHSTSVEVQTDDKLNPPVLIPVPVPIYVPCPMAMYSFPFPVPVPFPIPVPVPVFLPTTRNSIKGIMKELKRIQEKVPADPFEAELLMMAEMVADDKKEVVTSSDSEPDNEPAASDTRPNSDDEGDFSPEAMETSNNTFGDGDDIMQIALKIATELDEPAGEDLETQLTPSTIMNQSQAENAEGNSSGTETQQKPGPKSQKRTSRGSPQKRRSSTDTKKRKFNHNSDTSPQPPAEESKPDANLKLKYTFGVNAWKSWIIQKNAEIEKLNSTSSKKIKTFKPEILQLTADELNFSLCLFVREVKKPNGTSYAPDTIYYLCLGIQQYLFENGRIDNIFTDPYYETFTDALDELARKFSELFNDHHYIVTRVEEEHLWESKQLGAHSPHVLLSTLMFFNTKDFNLVNVDEHMMLSFSHIMKHWKRNPNQASSGSGRAPGSRNVLLRFYPPQSVLDDPNSKKKKVYEQHENEENPLRCPVKLYEFYMSKCPESVKNRNDVFYLQPERSCVPDSPVWYSTMALSKEPLEKMLNRVKMVKEINIALLTP